jgi:transcriptional regulator with XRE-family HTH domain
MMSVALWDDADRAAYISRLETMRQALGYSMQKNFAEALGVSTKRWSSYETGYPIPRETAWLLKQRFNVSIEWIWWGDTGNMPMPLLKQIQEIARKRKP